MKDLKKIKNKLNLLYLLITITLILLSTALYDKNHKEINHIINILIDNNEVHEIGKLQKLINKKITIKKGGYYTLVLSTIENSDQNFFVETSNLDMFKVKTTIEGKEKNIDLSYLNCSLNKSIDSCINLATNTFYLEPNQTYSLEIQSSLPSKIYDQLSNWNLSLVLSKNF